MTAATSATGFEPREQIRFETSIDYDKGDVSRF